MALRQIRIWSSGTPSVGLTLPANFELESGDLRYRSKISELAYSDGGRDSGDGMLSSCKIKIQGTFYGSDLTVAQYQDLLASLHSVNRYSDLRLMVTDSDSVDARYLNIGRILRCNNKFISGAEGRVAKVSLQATAVDPFWRLTAGSTVVAATGLTVSLTGLSNSGNVETYPTLRVESVSGAISKFSVTNQTNSETLTLSQGITGAGYIEINGEEGDVDNNGSNGLRYITGQFPSMEIGANNIQMVFNAALPANATVTVSWPNKTTIGP